MASSTSFLKFLILPAALLIAGAAQADQQASASFAVSVTLHSSSKAMAAAQLCPEGRPLSLLAASYVRVDCPAGMNVQTASGLNTGKANPGIPSKPSEVVVTF